MHGMKYKQVQFFYFICKNDQLRTVYNRCCDEHFRGQKPGRVGDPHAFGSVLESQREFGGEADELLGVRFEIPS